MSVFRGAEPTVTPADRLSIIQAADLLQKLFEDAETLKNVGIAPEEDQFKPYAAWDDDSVADHCIEANIFRGKLNNLFEKVTDKVGFTPREARTLLRELYHMPKDELIEKNNAKSLTDANYDEIVDLLVTISKVRRGQTFLVAPTPQSWP